MADLIVVHESIMNTDERMPFAADQRDHYCSTRTNHLGASGRI